MSHRTHEVINQSTPFVNGQLGHTHELNASVFYIKPHIVYLSIVGDYLVGRL